jgi:hypothetical protein
VRVDDVAAQMPVSGWQRYQIKEGAKGPLVAAFAFLRVVPVRSGMPGAECWLVVRRSLEEPAELKTYLSNAPPTTPPTTLVEKSGMRWPVEIAILEAKRDIGMDQYEVRGWVGWHHHTTMTLLAHHFLVQQRSRLGEKSGGVDGAASAPAVTGGVAQAAARCRNRTGPDPVYPRAKLCRVSLASTPPAASA